MSFFDFTKSLIGGDFDDEKASNETGHGLATGSHPEITSPFDLGSADNLLVYRQIDAMIRQTRLFRKLEIESRGIVIPLEKGGMLRFRPWMDTAKSFPFWELGRIRSEGLNNVLNSFMPIMLDALEFQRKKGAKRICEIIVSKAEAGGPRLALDDNDNAYWLLGYGDAFDGYAVVGALDQPTSFTVEMGREAECIASVQRYMETIRVDLKLLRSTFGLLIQSPEAFSDHSPALVEELSTAKAALESVERCASSFEEGVYDARSLQRIEEMLPAMYNLMMENFKRLTDSLNAMIVKDGEDSLPMVEGILGRQGEKTELYLNLADRIHNWLLLIHQISPKIEMFLDLIKTLHLVYLRSCFRESYHSYSSQLKLNDFHKNATDLLIKSSKLEILMSESLHHIEAVMRSVGDQRAREGGSGAEELVHMLSSLGDAIHYLRSSVEFNMDSLKHVVIDEGRRLNNRHMWMATDKSTHIFVKLADGDRIEGVWVKV